MDFFVRGLPTTETPKQTRRSPPKRYVTFADQDIMMSPIFDSTETPNSRLTTSSASPRTTISVGPTYAVPPSWYSAVVQSASPKDISSLNVDVEGDNSLLTRLRIARGATRHSDAEPQPEQRQLLDALTASTDPQAIAPSSAVVVAGASPPRAVAPSALSLSAQRPDVNPGCAVVRWACIVCPLNDELVLPKAACAVRYCPQCGAQQPA